MTTARDFYHLTYGSIQKDVMTYGPIEASFEVYDDFFSYKSGKSRLIIIKYYLFYANEIMNFKS